MPSVGFNFRRSAAYVTDGTDETHVIDDPDSPSYGDIYPQVRDGYTFGWTTAMQLTRDRSSSIDRRLAGFHGSYASANEIWRLDLDGLNGADTYTMRAAFGEANYAQSQYNEIRDNTTTRVTIDNTTQTGSERFTDINDANHTAAAWPGSNTSQDVLFNSTTFFLHAGDNSTKAGRVAHLYFEWTAGGGSAASARRGQRTQHILMR